MVSAIYHTVFLNKGARGILDRKVLMCGILLCILLPNPLSSSSVS